MLARRTCLPPVLCIGIPVGLNQMGGIGGVGIGLHNAVLPHHIDILWAIASRTPSTSFGTSTSTTNVNLCQWTVILINVVTIHICFSINRPLPLRPPPPGHPRVDRVYMDLPVGRSCVKGGGIDTGDQANTIKGCFYSSVSFFSSHVRPPPAPKVKPDPDEVKIQISKGRFRAVIDGAHLSGVFFYLCLYLQCQTGISMLPIK